MIEEDESKKKKKQKKGSVGFGVKIGTAHMQYYLYNNQLLIFMPNIFI